MTPHPADPTPTPPKTKPLHPDSSLAAIFESLLKEPNSLIETIENPHQTRKLTLKLIGLCLFGFLIFGLTLGSFSLSHQLWAAPLKSLIGISFAACICLPSLYVFSALSGTVLKLAEIIQGLIASLALVGALLLGFTPVLWIFSQSTHSEPFFGFLIGTTWLIAICFGTGFLTRMLYRSENVKKGPIRIWIGIFLIVTFQLSTSLRPLIGTSDVHFTTEKRFFIEHWVENLTKPIAPEGEVGER